TGDVVQEYLKHATGKLAIAFCVSRQHCQETTDAFSEAGVAAEVLDGSLNDIERAARVQRFRNRETHVLVTCDLVSEGFDLPAIEVVILLRPTASKGLYLQQVGRGLRTMPGKTEALILDHAGNVYRHGMPDARQEWSLEMDKARSKKVAS